MTINVLVIEDRSRTRSLLSAHLKRNLPRHATAAVAGCADPNGGRLSHLLPKRWERRPFTAEHFDVYALGDNEVGRLTEVTHGGERADLFGLIGDVAEAHFADRRRVPDVLIADLALSDGEQGDLIASHGNYVPICGQAVKDPRPTLEGMTGFCIIRAMTHPVQVIATSYASNPLVAQACVENGARAFVEKPVRERESDPSLVRWDMRSARRLGVAKIERLADAGSHPLAVVVHRYLTEMTAHVLDAVLAVALNALEDAGSETDVCR